MVGNIDCLPFSETTKKTLSDLCEILLSHLQPDLILLFGSYARLEHKATSDLDIAVVLRQKLDREIKGYLCSLFEQRNADLVFFTPNLLSTSSCLLAKNIRKDGIILWQTQIPT